MLHRLVLVVFIAFAATFSLHAQTLPAGVSKVRSVEGIDEYSLPNGLQVLLVTDVSMPTTTVNMTFRVGSRFE
jgi:zinc protease